MEKLYVYADETGQDTRGRLFVVAAVITGAERDEVRRLLKSIEYVSGKGKKKWTRATRRQKREYLTRAVQAGAFRGKLFFSRFTATTDYLSCMLQTIARSLTTTAHGQPYEAVVLIDGLSKKDQHRVASRLRQLKTRVTKVRGLRDEADEFIRLADAIAGFARDALEGHDYAQRIYQDAIQNDILHEL